MTRIAGKLGVFALALAIGLPGLATATGGKVADSNVAGVTVAPVLLGDAGEAEEPQQRRGFFSWLGKPKPKPKEKLRTLDRQYTSDDLGNRVKVFEFVRIEDILEPGEAMPDPTFHELYVAARAPRRLAAYCEDVVATIGEACDVLSTSLHERDGVFEITGVLVFVPSMDMGQRELTRGHGWHTAGFYFDPEAGRDDGAYPAYTAQSRRAAFERVRQLCNAMIAIYGSCEPESLTFEALGRWPSADMLEAQEPPRMRARGRIKIYAEESETVEDAVKETVAFAAKIGREPVLSGMGSARIWTVAARMVVLDVARSLMPYHELALVMARPLGTLGQ